MKNNIIKYSLIVIGILISIIILILIIMAIQNHGFKRLSLLMIIGGDLVNLYDR